MNVIIIEDEKPSARRLKRMLDSIGVEVTTMLHSVEEAITWFLNNEHPDLIMLDIQLSDGLSFEIFDAVTVKSAIIFTTAYDEYALKAFKLNAIDYLLKPIDEDELKHAIDQFTEKFNSNNNDKVAIDINEIRNLLGETKVEYKKRFTIKIGQHLKIIDVADIACFYSEDKSTYLHTSANRSYIIDTTLEQLEQKLDPTKYFRVSRKFFVCIDAIEDIISYTNSRLQIKLRNFNAFAIIVSREKVQEFKKWIS